ncbi:hypothetical protein Tco_0747826 [Tanacetum coccineum]|uniref:Histone deacetylase 14 n=1 Tax=Tanacetum coccineum TaxID=301880 RepID=A0ABQ4YU47_9ASTR
MADNECSQSAAPRSAPKRSNGKDTVHYSWVPWKEQLCLDLQKKQKNPIFQIFVDILQNINFFRAFTASALGIITSTNVDYVELMWEKFVQAIQTFLTDNANLGSPTKKCRKDKPHVIPYCRFTKLSICHLGRIHNIHQRSASPFHLAEKEPRLGNLKFVSKGEVEEVFGMLIPNELISNNIRNAPYYNAYMEMVAKHDQKVAAEKEGKKKTISAKQPKPKPAKENPSKPSIAKPPKPKPAKEKSTKATPLQKDDKGKVAKFREEYDVERAIQMSLQSFHTEGHAHVGEQAAQSLLALHTPKRRSTTDQFIFQRQTPMTEEASPRPSAQPQDDTSANIVRESLSPADAETGADTDKTNSGEKTDELDQGQAGSDPGKTPESRPPPEEVFMDEDQAGPDPGVSRVALVGPNPKPTHEEFMLMWYPYVHESLMFPADEQVILRNSLTVSYATQAPIFTATTTTTTTTLPPPPQQQSSTDSELVARVTTLEQKFFELEQKNKNLDNTTRNLRSRVFTLELRDLPHKIDEVVRESVKEVVHVALQAPLRDRFRELLEADMKEILHQRMFETSTYKSLPEHVALYEALEASMEQANMDEFLAEKDKSHKR